MSDAASGPASSGPLPVSLVVVNHQGGERLVRCLESLVADPRERFELFVVDNASEDGSLEAARAFAERRDDTEVVASPVNLGYAGALDLVLDRCAGRYVALLNMDLEAEPGWLAPLVRHLDAHPDVGAVNPLLLLEDGAVVNATGLDLHPSGLAFNRALGAPRASIALEPFDVPGVQGAVVVCRRDVLLAMGGLDDGGFLYHEDVRLSWALGAMGLRMACVPASAVRHAYRLSMHAEKLYLLERNRWVLLATALGWPSLLVISPVLLVTELMLLGYALLRGPRFVAAKLRAMRDAIRARGQRVDARRTWRVRRTVPELAQLRGMSLRYAWGQARTLAVERGAPRRPFEAPRPPAG